MKSFVWGPHFETGLNEVDEEHHRLVDLINQLGDSLAGDQVNEAELVKLIGELNAYAHYHFDNEEQLMVQRGMDQRYIEDHQSVHRGFLEDVQRFTVSDTSRVESLLNYLINWLGYHILGMDQSMARQLRSMAEGDTAAQSYEQELERDEGAVQPLLDAVTGLFSVVREQNLELQQLNDSLEQKVNDRTAELTRLSEQLQQMAMNDQLTGLANRRRALALLEELWVNSRGVDIPLSCLMIDADHFKEINDNFGHDAGDEVLRVLARELTHAFRTDDLVCRLGGDEFLVICPHTPLAAALLLAEQLHQRISALSVPAGVGRWQGSLSVGVAERQGTMGLPQDLIKAADKGVYAAKAAGRNCVRSSQIKSA